jgi:hypothetical protein
MHEDVAAFPLCWPEAWQRTKSRRYSTFKDWTVYSAVEDLMKRLNMFGAKHIVISTSVPLRKDGLPLSKPPVDGDPGAAVYFERKGKPYCIPCDQYNDVADNIHAVALTLEAIRTIERHGTPYMLEAMFKGYEALPAPSDWRSILGNPKTIDEAEANYRALARECHPDTGGSHEAMSELNEAIEVAREVLV